MKNGTAGLESDGKHILPCGLHCHLTMSQPKPDKPIVYTIEFMMDPIALSNWLDSPEIAWMTISGPLLFNVMGFRAIIPQKNQRKSNQDISWVVDSPMGSIHFNLIERPARFRVHRDVISKVEWEVHLDEMPS